MTDNIPSEMKTSGTSRAVVIDIVYWDRGHAKLVEHSLSTGRVAITVAGHTLVNIVVVDLGIEQSLDSSFVAELCIVNLSSWLDELGHANPEDVAWLIAFDDHLEDEEGGGFGW